MFREELEKKLKAELIQICEESGLDSSGLKTELVDRIWASQITEDEPIEKPITSEPYVALAELEPQTTEEETVVVGYPEPKLVVPEKADTVKVEVVIGTLEWEEGRFSKGDVFTVSSERAARFDRTSVKIIE